MGTIALRGRFHRTLKRVKDHVKWLTEKTGEGETQGALENDNAVFDSFEGDIFGHNLPSLAVSS